MVWDRVKKHDGRQCFFGLVMCGAPKMFALRLWQPNSCDESEGEQSIEQHGDLQAGSVSGGARDSVLLGHVREQLHV